MPSSNDNLKESTQTIDDVYHRQRDITSNNPIQATIKSVLYNSETKCLEFITEVNNFTIQLEMNLTDSTDTTKQFINNAFTADGKITIPDLPFSIELKFDEGLTKATDESTNQVFTVIDTDPNEILPDGEYVANTNKIPAIIEEKLLKQQYNTSSEDKPGLSANITHITNIAGDDFTVTVQPTKYTEKEFNITIDSLDSMVDTPLQTLIENQGGGSPTMLDNQGEVILIHSSDIDKNLETIPRTQNLEQEWEITAPQTHAEWVPVTTETESNETYSSKNNLTKSKYQIRKDMIESFKSAGRFAAFSLGIKLFNYIYLDALSSETIPQSITELAFSMFTDIGPLASNMLVLFSMVHVIFGVVKYIHLKR